MDLDGREGKVDRMCEDLGCHGCEGATNRKPNALLCDLSPIWMVYEPNVSRKTALNISEG
ncbi:MAG: hypothetical protein Rhob2KO_40000 [Rhodopirellula baltica]